MSSKNLIKNPKFVGAIALLTVALTAFLVLPSQEANAAEQPAVVPMLLKAEPTAPPSAPVANTAEPIPAAKAAEPKDEECTLTNIDPQTTWGKVKRMLEQTGCKLGFTHKDDDDHS